MAETHDVETDHVYDGIREFDNPLPRWWLLTFWGSIVFAAFYWFAYQSLGNAPGSMKVYAQEKAAYDAKMLEQSVSPEELAALITDPGVIDQGKAVFGQHCAACHGTKGEGGVGPNLTDDYALHGLEPVDLYKTVSLGVTAKGMAAWRPTLGDKRVREVVAYVTTLQGLNLPGKEPQGKKAAAAGAK